MPGSGKSDCACALARRLGWSWMDTDSEIEKNEGRTIAEIFEQSGESTFRDLERQLLVHLLGSSPQNIVVSTGGGLPVTAGNWELLQRLGTIVYLEVPCDILATRVGDGTARPLLSGSVPDKLMDLLRAREPVYRQAQYIVDAAAGSPDDIADAIATMVQ
jgi:shikimate kinase